MRTEDDLNTSAIALVGLIGTILVFATVVLLTVVFYQVEARQQHEKDINQQPAQVAKLTADQQGRLASYGWVDREEKVAHIPISRAMDLVVAEIARDPGAASPEPPAPEQKAAPAQQDSPKEDKDAD
jgi:hypothetical protein